MGIADKLIEKYGSTEETFEVVVGDEILLFKNLNDMADVQRLDKRGRKFAADHVAGKNLINDAWKAAATKDKNVALLAFIVAELSLEPTKMSVVEVLMLAKKAGPLLTHIATEVHARMQFKSAQFEIDELDELGED